VLSHPTDRALCSLEIAMYGLVTEMRKVLKVSASRYTVEIRLKHGVSAFAAESPEGVNAWAPAMRVLLARLSQSVSQEMARTREHQPNGDEL